MNRKIVLCHYKQEDLDEISKAESPERINQIRKMVFGRMRNPLHYVMGASTSGARSVEVNKTRTLAFMGWLKAQGVSAPNYYPLVKRLNQILRKDYREKNLSKSQEYEVRMSILNGFHKPILLDYEGIKLRLMPGWESSDRCWPLREFARDNGVIIQPISDIHIYMAEELSAKKVLTTK